MYLKFYNFSENPFHITPDTGFFFLSPGHREALVSVIYGIEQRKGFITIGGEAGVGKTTTVSSCPELCKQQHMKIVYVFNPDISTTLGKTRSTLPMIPNSFS